MTRDLPDHIARRRAAAIAGHQGDAATARTFLDDADPAVRATALGALARSGDLHPADLDRGLDDEVATVRARAAELAATRPGDGPPPLAPVLDDPDPVVVEAAAWSCGERDPAEPGIVDVLSRSAPATTTRCAGRRRSPPSAPSATRRACRRSWPPPATGPRSAAGRSWRWRRSTGARSTRPSSGPSATATGRSARRPRTSPAERGPVGAGSQSIGWKRTMSERTVLRADSASAASSDTPVTTYATFVKSFSAA